MSAATVAEPFLLSSYPESSAPRKRKETPLYSSLPSGSDADPFVTVAVQGDGVHILDTSTLHPAVSYTLGPSTSFSTAPATRITQAKDGVRICSTYAVLEAGPDVQPEGKGKTVIAWDEPLSGGISSDLPAEKRRRVVVAPHPVSHIYAPDFLLTGVVLVGDAGQVSVADKDLQVFETLTPQSHHSSTLLKHFLFPAASCSFFSPHTSQSFSAASVSFLRGGDVLRLNVVGIEAETASLLGECIVPVEESDVLDISCSSSGVICILLPSGIWHALSLTASRSSSLSISPIFDPLRLQNLTFISTTRMQEVSLVALTSSHVLLSAITVGSPEIVILLWDIRYGVLLAQHTLQVPSTLPRPKKHGAILRLDASSLSTPISGSTKASAVSMNVLLTLLPVPEREYQGEAAARSTILVVPVTVPFTSTIAAAMGKAHSGARWVSSKPVGQAQGPIVRGGPELSAAARKALHEIRAAVDGSANGSTTAAETSFFGYVKQQCKGKGTAQGGEIQATPIEYPFVQGVLELVLRAPAAAQGSSAKTPSGYAYSSKIVKHLLENRAVSSSMVGGGLLLALAVRGDWDAVTLAMRSVSDLPESDTISLLSQVVAAHNHGLSTANEDAMDVDSAPTPTSTPALPAFLAQCVDYPFTPAQERAAVRKYLPDATDLIPVLEVLDGWIVDHTENDALLSDGTSSADIPSLDKILVFLQTLLDASFLALLAHSPAHRLLRTLASHIQPALTRAGELELLCGPLEPFAKAAAAKAKAQAEAKEGVKPDSSKDWRRKKRLAHEQAGMTVGLYRVEELVL